jgi:ATP-binding cassette subfamily B multidrug efflux pump
VASVLYGWLLLRWTIVRVGPASQGQRGCALGHDGRVVDSYTNIHSVKLFAHHDREIDYAKEAIEQHAPDLRKEMRIFTIMDVALTALNGLLIVAVVGWAILAVGRDAATWAWWRRRRR